MQIDEYFRFRNSPRSREISQPIVRLTSLVCAPEMKIRTLPSGEERTVQLELSNSERKMEMLLKLPEQPNT